MARGSLVRKIVYALLALALVYLGLGLGFHVKWEQAQDRCRAERLARDEFVDPEVFGGLLGALFDVTNWPVYAAANIHHFGIPFATPCDH